MMAIQQEIYWIICIIKNIKNSLIQIYQDKPNTSIPQQINFAVKLEDYCLTEFFISDKQQKTILNVSLDSLDVNKGTSKKIIE